MWIIKANGDTDSKGRQHGWAPSLLSCRSFHVKNQAAGMPSESWSTIAKEVIQIQPWLMAKSLAFWLLPKCSLPIFAAVQLGTQADNHMQLTRPKANYQVNAQWCYLEKAWDRAMCIDSKILTRTTSFCWTTCSNERVTLVRSQCSMRHTLHALRDVHTAPCVIATCSRFSDGPRTPACELQWKSDCNRKPSIVTLEGASECIYYGAQVQGQA